MPSLEREKRASQLGTIIRPIVLPFAPGQVKMGELAHIQGYYAGLTYGKGPTGVTLQPFSYRPHYRPRKR